MVLSSRCAAFHQFMFTARFADDEGDSDDDEQPDKAARVKTNKKKAKNFYSDAK